MRQHYKLCYKPEDENFHLAVSSIKVNVSSPGLYNKANIFLGLIENELNNLLGASHLVDYISVHIRFDFE